MILHAERNPGHERLDVPGCYGCSIASIAFSGEMLVTRSPEVVEAAARERRWDKDIPAYKTLRKQGMQPKTSEGAHRLAATANTREEVEKLPKLWKHREEILGSTLPERVT